MLPGPTCEDIKDGLCAGVFNAQSEVIGIERDPVVFVKMRRNGSQLPIRFRPVHSDLEDYSPAGKFDLFALDFCGSMTAEIAAWIERNHHYLRPGGRLIYTTLFGPRRNLYLREQTRRCLEGDWAEDYAEFIQYVPLQKSAPGMYVTEFLIHRLTQNRFGAAQSYEYGDGRPMRVYVFK